MSVRKAFLLAVVAIFTVLLVSSAAAQDTLRKESLDFLKVMLACPSPSGYEQPAQKMWSDYTRPFAKVSGDGKGNAIGVVNPAGKPRIMFAGHCDEIGFVVQYINGEGFIAFSALGGFDEPIIPGRIVVIHTSRGPVQGVVGKSPIHLMSEADRSRGAKIDDLLIDIGAKDKKEAESIVMLGDPITYPESFLELRNDVYVARAFDDRIGSFIIAETLRELSRSKSLRAAVHGVSTVQEEIGAAGARTSAFEIDPLVGIAIDVTHAADQPKVERRMAGDVALGGGPVISRGAHCNPKVFDLLVKVAKERGIPYQIDVSPSRTGTDTDVIHINRAGVAAGVVSIPLRYMHTPVETLRMSDVANTIRLLVAFSEAVQENTSFMP
ncbi:MAG: M42 family metallopeptidase [Candidatus Latescibacterota bacterium]